MNPNDPNQLPNQLPSEPVLDAPNAPMEVAQPQADTTQPGVITENIGTVENSNTPEQAMVGGMNAIKAGSKATLWMTVAGVITALVIITLGVVYFYSVNSNKSTGTNTSTITKSTDLNSSVQLTPEIIKKLGRDIHAVNAYALGKNALEVNQSIKKNDEDGLIEGLTPAQSAVINKTTNQQTCAFVRDLYDNVFTPSGGDPAKLSKYVDAEKLFSELDATSDTLAGQLCLEDKSNFTAIYNDLKKSGPANLLSSLSDYSKIDTLAITQNEKKIVKYVAIKKLVAINFLDEDFFKKNILGVSDTYDASKYYTITKDESGTEIYGVPTWEVKINIGSLDSKLGIQGDTYYTVQYKDGSWVVY